MDEQTRTKLIEKYAEGYQTIEEALKGITDRELDARPAPNKWTSREIVHHLADSEMTSAIRLRLLLVQDRPAIVSYDQDEFARRLYYDRPIDASLKAFRAARETTVQILKRMTPDQWTREGTHPEHGRYSVERWLEIYSNHAHKHADQIRRARASAQ